MSEWNAYVPVLLNQSECPEVAGFRHKKTGFREPVFLFNGGEGGIRTLDTLLTYTHFPGVRLQPLGHLSNKPFQISDVVTDLRAQTLMVLQAIGNSLWKNRQKISGIADISVYRLDRFRTMVNDAGNNGPAGHGGYLWSPDAI